MVHGFMASFSSSLLSLRMTSNRTFLQVRVDSAPDSMNRCLALLSIHRPLHFRRGYLLYVRCANLAL